MKLYTEEQVTILTSASFAAGQNHNTFIFGEAFKDITPIELPTDEEIEKGSSNTAIISSQKAFIRGAKWMRDKIQGGKL